MQKLKSAASAAAEEKAVSAYDIGYREKPVYDIFKRFGDIVCSLLALIVLSPLLIAVAAAIMIEDSGSPIYAQKRTGKDSKTFIMYKFRSMRIGAEKERDSLLSKNEVDGPLFKIADDPRVTRVGKFIRRTSIDELPQLVNIIKGDMSIIGPRPLATYEQDKCTEYQKQRLLVKPGLSCYTALEKNSKENFDHWIELDMKYIRERSVFTDIKIILRTMGVVLGFKNL